MSEGKPRFVIVDENDNVIGSKERAEIKQEDIYRVSGLWIVNSKGYILLARRGLTKAHDPGKWGPAVAGTVELGESYLDNIIKEAEEELGLRNIHPTEGPKRRASGQYNYFSQSYLLALDIDIAELRIQKEEVEEVRWFSLEDLKERLDRNPDDFLKSVPRWAEMFLSKKTGK